LKFETKSILPTFSKIKKTLPKKDIFFYKRSEKSEGAFAVGLRIFV
jgi:hypothetical protein